MEDEDTREFYGHVGLWLDPPRAQVMNLYVVPEHRHAGLGRFLMEFMLAFLKSRDVDTLTLEVRPTNTIAISYYRSFGFTKATVRKHYYEDGEDADLMLLNIQ
jgi:ribosomal-protein-alanine N-acetyltransferase